MLKGVGIFYPGPPEVAHSSLAFHLLSSYFRDLLKVPVYHYYFEDDEIKVLGRVPDPSKLPLIFVSVPFELLYPLVVRMLHRAGIEPRRSKRSLPIVVGGGPPLIANPLPLFELFDVIVIGEAEPVLEDLALLINCKENDKDSCLENVSNLSGVLVPSEPRRVEKVHIRDLNKSWYPVDLYLEKGVEPIWGRAYLLETSRGCGRGCRFCLEGHVFRPPRHRTFHVLRDLLVEGVRRNDVSKVSFYSLAFFDNPHADDILSFAVNDLNLEVSVPSIRIETLTAERSKSIARGGQKTLTLAPETGSERIGVALNKRIEKDLVISVIDEALEAGIKSIKLYIIVAVPGETSEDVQDTIGLVEKVHDVVKKHGSRLKVSMNPLIPKPSTPLQWLGFNESYAERRLKEVVKGLKKIGVVNVDVYKARLATLQAVLALGDERLSEPLIEWGLRGGGIKSLEKTARELKVNINDFLMEKEVEVEPPWHKYVYNPFADISYLRREYLKFLEVVSQ